MLKTTLLVAALVIAAFPAWAQARRPGTPALDPATGRGTSSDERACRPDAVKLCPELIGNDMAVLACFKQNRTKLSPACTAVLQGYGQL